METFVPHPDLAASVATYNRSSIQLQSVSIMKLLNILHEVRGIEDPTVYARHPEVIKWKGYEPWLCEFGYAVVEKLDFDPFKAKQAMEWHMECATGGEYSMDKPAWWGDPEYHRADQAALLRLNYGHYREHFPNVPLDLPPYWIRFHQHHG